MPHRLTHVGFVFERELAVIASAMEMSGPLAVKPAVWRPTFLGGSESLESFLYDGRVFPMVVRVHLHVRRADVHLIARALQHCACVLCVNNWTAMTKVGRFSGKGARQ